MQVQITGKNLNVGSALTSHIEQRLQQIAERYFEGTTGAMSRWRSSAPPS